MVVVVSRPKQFQVENIVLCDVCAFQSTVEEAFSITMRPSSCPDSLIFKRFKAFWPNIVYSDYKAGIEVPDLLNALVYVLDEMKTFLTG